MKKNFINNIKKIKSNKELIWAFLKYQIITKIFLILVIFPVLKYLLRLVLLSMGRRSLTSGDFVSGLLSFRGTGILICTLLIIFFLTIFDINTFIVSSALYKENKFNPGLRNMILLGIKSFKNLLNISGVFIAIYVALSFSLLGFRIIYTPIKNFQIPNFIKEFLFSNDIYFLAYYIIGFIIIITLIIYIFTFHFLTIEDMSLVDAMKSSRKLILENKKDFIIRFIILKMLMWFIVYVGFNFLILTIINYISSLNISMFISRVFTIFLSFSLYQFLTLVILMIAPYFISELTNLYYDYRKNNLDNEKFIKYYSIEKQNVKSKIDFKKYGIIFGVGLFVFNVLFSIINSYFFDNLYRESSVINIVAHRAGGFLEVENSIEGLKKAIEFKAAYSEIDVQRTKDGHYIINHDNTLNRLTGVDLKSSQLNLKEIKKLNLKTSSNSFKKGQKIATIEEMLDVSKGKIKLLIELKGATADKKMVDDLVKIVKERDMINETVLISLDYNLIKYIEEKYPEIYSGYLYYFSFGDLSDLKCDYFLMEENQVTESSLEKIKLMGKKAMVWTVNSYYNMKKFTNMSLDGIITDRVEELKNLKEILSKRSDFEIILDNFLFN